MIDYTPPKWMKTPQDKWRLDEIKSGVIVNSYNVKVPLVIFGRTPPPMDSIIHGSAAAENEDEGDNNGCLIILTAHESCSRLHARIAFDSSGIPWLRDLGSGNGTKGKGVCHVFSVCLLLLDIFFK
jgi:hypothetical protein